MKKDYRGMSYDEIHSEFAHLNRKLILPNILIAIISIIACIAQLFMPFFEMTIHLNSDVVSAVVDTLFEDDESLVGDDSNDILAAVLTKDNIKKATSSLNNSFTIKIDAHELLVIAFASDETVEEEIIGVLAEILEDMDLKNELEKALKALIPSVVGVAVTATITSLSDELGLTDEQAAIVESCGDDIAAAVQKLADAGTITDEVKEEVKSDVKDSVSETMAELGYTEEDYAAVAEQIDTYFDAFIDAATDEETNEFSYLTMMENLDSLIEALSSGELSTGESAVGGITLASYTLTDDSTDSGTSTTDADSTTATINYYLSLLDNPKELIKEILGEDAFSSETIQTIQLGAEGLLIFIAVIAGLWAILALFAVLHIFLHNKKVGMWYVKLFGGLAAFLFFLLPTALFAFTNTYATTLASMLGADASILTTLANAFSFGGAEIVVLVCLLALWIVSIFWCHPIKKKIKRCHKALKIAKKAEK